MAALFTDFLPGFLDALLKIMQKEKYLVKGGQAIQYHMSKLYRRSDARFSRDIDISLSSSNFPFDIEIFKERLVDEYI